MQIRHQTKIHSSVCICFSCFISNLCVKCVVFCVMLVIKPGQIYVASFILFLSLQQQRVPKLWKHATIVPVAKTKTPATLNDFRPVALTSLVMKTLEKFIKNDCRWRNFLTRCSLHTGLTEVWRMLLFTFTHTNALYRCLVWKLDFGQQKQAWQPHQGGQEDFTEESSTSYRPV